MIARELGKQNKKAA
ncbi:hypothetical protein [Escherichia coli]|nr:hypothetical protein [Escherichia coli]